MVNEHLSFQVIKLVLHATCFKSFHPFIMFLEVSIQILHADTCRALYRFMDSRQAQAAFIHRVGFIIGFNDMRIDKRTTISLVFRIVIGHDVKVDNQSDSWGQIALQGPEAEKYAIEVLGLTEAAALGFYTYYNGTFCHFDQAECVEKSVRIVVSRTGYTGEDGFEIYASHAVINEMWDKLLEAGVVPCGLGCRDTLRFEAGLPLYGHELSDEVTPLEAGLGMFAKVKTKAEFIGREALVAQKEAGLTRKSVGIELQDKAIPRAGYPVEINGEQVGVVTTGYRSISTDRSV